MIISIALLGYGASGTFLAIFPRVQEKISKNIFSMLALLAGVSMLGAYLILNWFPFDSFSITWDRRQLVLLLLDYIALTMPFFFTGLGVGLMLSVYPHFSGQVYSVNLLGSSMGCALAILLPPIVGGEGMVVVSATLAVIAAMIMYS